MPRDIEREARVRRAAQELLREAARWDLRWAEAEAIVRQKLTDLRRSLRSNCSVDWAAPLN